ncbi:hypothetical protein BDP27DRAFT_440331 [Rhodocollybia butyracea]|uniref:Uncharacterized protein n=1 Tax=Rhodocollybia butyracea TaxID=206335 RepID=A0A9P5PTJ5_9AGAR|nr:hypothetical protein BDP27DRAFT_440331 [Rhodocollybia butyracea]
MRKQNHLPLSTFIRVHNANSRLRNVELRVADSSISMFHTVALYRIHLNLFIHLPLRIHRLVYNTSPNTSLRNIGSTNVTGFLRFLPSIGILDKEDMLPVAFHAFTITSPRKTLDTLLISHNGTTHTSLPDSLAAATTSRSQISSIIDSSTRLAQSKRPWH